MTMKYGPAQTTSSNGKLPPWPSTAMSRMLMTSWMAGMSAIAQTAPV